MKHFNFLAIVAVIGLLFVSCEKEGKFSPNKKIDRIYASGTRELQSFDGNVWTTIQEDSSPKTLREQWNWEGDLLTSIEYHTIGYDSYNDVYYDNAYTEYYEYDDNRLVAINWGGEPHYSISYDHGKISKIELFWNPESDVPSETYEFTHKNGKISEIKFYEGFYLTRPAYTMNAFRFFIPSASMASFVKVMDRVRGTMNSKNPDPSIIQFEWKGNNVKKMTYINSGHTDVIEYAYDNKLNPFYGLFNMEEFGNKPFLSKNNITSDGSCEITYTYDGNFPVTQTCSYTITYGDERENNTSVYYYEYK